MFLAVNAITRVLIVSNVFKCHTSVWCPVGVRRHVETPGGCRESMSGSLSERGGKGVACQPLQHWNPRMILEYYRCESVGGFMLHCHNLWWAEPIPDGRKVGRLLHAPGFCDPHTPWVFLGSEWQVSFSFLSLAFGNVGWCFSRQSQADGQIQESRMCKGAQIWDWTWVWIKNHRRNTSQPMEHKGPTLTHRLWTHFDSWVVLWFLTRMSSVKQTSKTLQPSAHCFGSCRHNRHSRRNHHSHRSRHSRRSRSRHSRRNRRNRHSRRSRHSLPPSHKVDLAGALEIHSPEYCKEIVNDCKVQTSWGFVYVWWPVSPSTFQSDLFFGSSRFRWKMLTHIHQRTSSPATHLEATRRGTLDSRPWVLYTHPLLPQQSWTKGFHPPLYSLVMLGGSPCLEKEAWS